MFGNIAVYNKFTSELLEDKMASNELEKEKPSTSIFLVEKFF